MSTVVSAAAAAAAADINSLSTDLIHHILSLLPLPSLLRSASVCKLWRSLILSSGGAAAANSSPWFFLLGVHNTSSRNHQSFAFDPLSSAWHLLPSPPSSPSSVSADSLSSPLLFSITTPLFSFSTPFHPLNPSFLPPLHFPRINPLVATVGPGQSFVVVGGVKFIGNLVDIEDDRLPVEIFDPDSNSWRLHDPLPPEFHPANSFSLSSALFCRRLHVFGISNHLLSSFNLDTLSWSPAVPLRPPGLQSGFLVSCREKLLLVGLSNGGAADASFSLWEICDGDGSAGFVRIAVMPGELLEWLVEGSGEDENKYASIKCVGTGDLVYVFNEEYYKKYPACVCDVGKGEWRRLPELPSPFNKFHKVISFSSQVSIQSVLPQALREGGDIEYMT